MTAPALSSVQGLTSSRPLVPEEVPQRRHEEASKKNSTGHHQQERRLEVVIMNCVINECLHQQVL